jgi:CO/xanthine dehydrogenase Mo-binding subunit
VGIKSGATTGLSYSTIRLLFDGSVTIYAGTSDMGQGARTIFAQIDADELVVPIDQIDVVMGDTSVVPFDLQTSASRSTVFMGNAILDACRDIQLQVRELAAELHRTALENVRIEAGGVFISGVRVSIPEVVQASLGGLRGELIGNGTMRRTDIANHPLGGSPAFFEFNCTAFEVWVYVETGEVSVMKHVSVGDTGTSLNPLQVEMQDEGAAIMGLGHTMMEHVILDEAGRIANLGALDYRIPTSKDLPLSLSTYSIENADGPGPYGSKGVSEGAILCTAPAFASAVTEATGVVIRDLPLTPERVWRAMREGAFDPSKVEQV